LPMLGIGIFIGGYVSFKKSNRSNAKGWCTNIFFTYFDWNF
jgi:hypothetical protein